MIRKNYNMNYLIHNSKYTTILFSFLIILSILPLSKCFNNINASTYQSSIITNIKILEDSLKEVSLSLQNYSSLYNKELQNIHKECFKISGTIKDRNKNYLILFGTAIPIDEDYSKEGTLFESGNVEVENAYIDEIMANYYGVKGNAVHRYLGKHYGINVFGSLVPVYKFGSPLEVVDTLVNTRKKYQETYDYMTDRYICEITNLIKYQYDNNSVDSAKISFLKYRYNEILQKDKIVKWEIEVRKWLPISDQEIKSRKIGSVLAEEYFIQAEDALEQNKFSLALDFINKAKEYTYQEKYGNIILNASIGKADSLLMKAVYYINSNKYNDEWYYRKAQNNIFEAKKIHPFYQQNVHQYQMKLRKNKSKLVALSLSIIPYAGFSYANKSLEGLGILLLQMSFSPLLFSDNSEKRVIGYCSYGLFTVYSMIRSYQGVVQYNNQRNFERNMFTNKTTKEFKIIRVCLQIQL